jgi:hypothetical protein
VVDSEGSSENVEFFKLDGAIMLCIFCEYLFEGVGLFLDLTDFFLNLFFPVDFFYLFWFEVASALEIGYFG